MKKVFILIVLLTVSLISQAQNVVYDENAEVRTVEEFTAIEVSGAISLYLSQGMNQGVAVSAGEAKYNNKIRTNVSNGVLKLSVDAGVWNGFNWTNKKLKAYVTVADLKRLHVSGASYVSFAGPIKANDLTMEISGASEVKGNINANKLNLNISGASIARLSGTTGEAVIGASGACKVNAYDLSIDTCQASTTGASDIRITVNKELNANASGGSAISYKGGGIAKNINAQAGASIKNRGGIDK